MYYIVVDLEWNQSPQGRGTEEKNLPFEIIEIGAVKLNQDLEIIGEFRELIHPQVYKEIHSKTQEIIHVDMDALNEGISFKEAAERFFAWCGSEYVFCTWGLMDLTELQRNLDYYGMTEYIRGPVQYYDIQKLFSICYEGKKNPRMLSYAIEFLEIDDIEGFHQALFDARYTAKVLQRLDMNIVQKYYSLDYYNNPKSKEEEIYLVYDNYTKFISREYDSKESAFDDKEIKDIECYMCKKKVPKKVRWFSNNSKIYYCLAYCREHGYLKGKIRVKKSVDGKYFIVKTIKEISNEAADTIRLKQEELKYKKKYRKTHKKRGRTAY